MLKVIIEIIIGVARAAFGEYMAKKPKNTKVYKRSDYSSDGKKKSNQNNDFADTSSDTSTDDSNDQDVVIESIDEDNSNANVVAKDESKDESNSENKDKTSSKFAKKIKDLADYYSDDDDLGDLFSDILEAKKKLENEGDSPKNSDTSDASEDSKDSKSNKSDNKSSNSKENNRYMRIDFDVNKFVGKSRKWRWIIVAIVVAIAFICSIIFGFSTFITDCMWYAQLGFESVIWIQLAAKIGVWALYALLMAAFGYLSAYIAIKKRPGSEDGVYVKEKGNILDTKKGISSKLAMHVAGVVSLIVGAVFGMQFYNHWVQILLMFNYQSFGIKDPQFGFDNGFYVFVLPGLRLFTRAFIVLLAVSLLFSVITNALMGAVRITLPVGGKGIFNITKSARRQISAWFMLVIIFWSVLQILDVFAIVNLDGSKITGGSYTDMNAGVPSSIAMAVITLIVGIVITTWLLKSHALNGNVKIGTRFAVAVKAWRTPAIAVASLVVCAMVLSFAWPALLQRFKVAPNAQELEATYIQRNIDATKFAYGLNNVKKESYNATSEGKSGALAKEAESTAQIRLLDPQVTSPTFRQLQQSKQYYTFADTLSVDKYDIDGVSQDTVIAARELDLAGNDNRNWVNDHTVYTHGYGVVAAYGNKVTADGQPQFMEYGIPTQGKLTKLKKYEPRIYFSPNAPKYSIVGSPKGTAPWEFDYPTGSNGALTTFKGNGGPRVGNFFSRLLHAIRFESDQILFSDRVTSDSQILYDRDPKTRVSKVAPYLTLDGRVYPAVVDGRVKWIVDGYTTSDSYPYSQMTDFGQVTQDSTTTTSRSIKGLTNQRANYIRNSVKATVDAYDGSVDLYVWDKKDPVIKAWRSIFPGHYHDISKISGDLMSHIRYPESLFKVQRHLLAKYHVDSASQFFSGEDFWQTPVDPTESQSLQREDILQPPYYLTLQTRGANKPVFSLVSTYIPAGKITREILTGFLSVDSDAGNVAGKVSENYGKLRLQELPKVSNVPGPGQAQNNFNANANVSKELNLLESGSTKVKRGNLLTLPLGGGLVYVEPVYVQSSGSTSYPLLKKVLVAFGDQVGFADTLDEALNQVFGGNSGANAGDASNNSGSNENVSNKNNANNANKSDAKSSANAPAKSNSISEKARIALKRAAQALKDSDSAMRSGNWQAYGKAQKELSDAINDAMSEEAVK
jgi:integral membrane protein